MGAAKHVDQFYPRGPSHHGVERNYHEELLAREPTAEERTDACSVVAALSDGAVDRGPLQRSPLAEFVRWAAQRRVEIKRELRRMGVIVGARVHR